MNQKQMAEIEKMQLETNRIKERMQYNIVAIDFIKENNLYQRLKECQNYVLLKFNAVLTDYGLVGVENYNICKHLGKPYSDVDFDIQLRHLLVFLKNNEHILKETKRVSYDRSSYGMKHTYSYHARDYYNKKGITNTYCTNGQFIFAMYVLGYDIFVNRTPTELISCGDVRLFQNFCCNVFFNAKFNDKELRVEQFN